MASSLVFYGIPDCVQTSASLTLNILLGCLFSACWFCPIPMCSVFLKSYYILLKRKHTYCVYLIPDAEEVETGTSLGLSDLLPCLAYFVSSRHWEIYLFKKCVALKKDRDTQFS